MFQWIDRNCMWVICGVSVDVVTYMYAISWAFLNVKVNWTKGTKLTFASKNMTKYALVAVVGFCFIFAFKGCTRYLFAIFVILLLSAPCFHIWISAFVVALFRLLGTRHYMQVTIRLRSNFERCVRNLLVIAKIVMLISQNTKWSFHNILVVVIFNTISYVQYILGDSSFIIQ